MIKDFAFIAYSVNDVPRSVAFYRDVVGLKPGQSFGDHWAEFDLGTSAFGIGNGTALGMIPGTSHSAAFEVDNLAAERDRLIANGVQVTEVSEFPGCFTCFVTDPDGNRFALHQRKSA